MVLDVPSSWGSPFPAQGGERKSLSCWWIIIIADVCEVVPPVQGPTISTFHGIYSYQQPWRSTGPHFTNEPNNAPRWAEFKPDLGFRA